MEKIVIDEIRYAWKLTSIESVTLDTVSHLSTNNQQRKGVVHTFAQREKEERILAQPFMRTESLFGATTSINGIDSARKRKNTEVRRPSNFVFAQEQRRKPPYCFWFACEGIRTPFSVSLPSSSTQAHCAARGMVGGGLWVFHINQSTPHYSSIWAFWIVGKMPIFGGKITSGFTDPSYSEVPIFLDRAVRFLEDYVCTQFTPPSHTPHSCGMIKSSGLSRKISQDAIRSCSFFWRISFFTICMLQYPHFLVSVKYSTCSIYPINPTRLRPIYLFLTHFHIIERDTIHLHV
jgi:hypothetical protein